tara:strand:- start:803 stop:1189 length:387 start_codon:yes stop_codon:yes gene_type:complete
MFNQLFIGIILVLSLGGYWLYSENQTLKANSIKLESAVAEQKATLAAVQESFEKQTESLQNMTRANQQIEAERDQYLAIFKRHNVNKLAVAKPGLIEDSFNKGTAKVFEDIENDSQNIADLSKPIIPK